MLSRDDLVRALKKDEPLVLPREQLAKLERDFEIARRIDTCFAGEILVFEGSGVVFAVEFPPQSKESLVARRLKSREHAEEFIEARMAVYDRMWDGCGCRVDYYKK